MKKVKEQSIETELTYDEKKQNMLYDFSIALKKLNQDYIELRKKLDILYPPENKDENKNR
jgi:hypothetical protein